jgi:hypothetical protein
MGTSNGAEVYNLAELITEAWDCAMSDSGHVWEKAERKLEDALVGVSDKTKEDAYRFARLVRKGQEKRAWDNDGLSLDDLANLIIEVVLINVTDREDQWVEAHTALMRGLEFVSDQAKSEAYSLAHYRATK